jgi:uncharacterized protein YjbI with pentapeptide repeats
MANPAHEALLRQGLDEWNQWRTRNPSVTPDLAGVSMSAAVLPGVDLSHARLRGATLIRARLAGADLRYADLRQAHLHETDFSEADLSRANLDGAQLPGAKLRGARLVAATLRGAQLTVVDLRKADLREAVLEDCDLRESLGTGASFVKANLSGAELLGCRLTECNLAGAVGLTSRQLESAIVDESAVLPERFFAPVPGASIASLREAIEALRSRSTGATVSETEVSSYHALLGKLEAQGFDTEKARVMESELVRAVTSWERSRGGESFEVAPLRWMDAAVFRRKIDAVLNDLRRR